MVRVLRKIGDKEELSGKVVQIEKADIFQTIEKEQTKTLIAELDNSVQVVLQELREYLAAA